VGARVVFGAAKGSRRRRGAGKHEPSDLHRCGRDTHLTPGTARELQAEVSETARHQHEPPGAPLSIIQWINADPDEPKPKEQKIDCIVFIAVDSKPRGEASLDSSAHPPRITTVLKASATNPMENYSTDTFEMARLFVSRWNLEQGSAPGIGPQIALYVIHVRFELERDEKIRRDLQAVPTKLQLSADEVALLVEKGSSLLRQTIQYRCLMKKIGAPGSADPVPPEDLVLCPE
jgi:hypothetical protein